MMSWVTFSPHFVLVSSYHPVESLFINFVGFFFHENMVFSCAMLRRKGPKKQVFFFKKDHVRKAS